MGVPAFFRWLSRKYPSIVLECNEEKQFFADENQKTPVDSSKPNPNGIEFDNLYLDMNGIIHPCTHPEDKPAPKNEDEMMIAIFEAIDRIFNIVRPRKLLYMAIDGVAPRAKMNQQRSRRFRASKEAGEKEKEVARIKEELKRKGISLPVTESGEHFDSNCITPGTPFMDRLSKCLHYYIYDRLNNDPGWQNIKVVLSDANSPGEGEHKIMDYIRRQRSQSGHDPNTHHVLCGADADLIMLGLATHEPYFTIIREEFVPNKPRPCSICNGIAHPQDCMIRRYVAAKVGVERQPWWLQHKPPDGRQGHELNECEGVMATDTEKIFSDVNYIFIRLSVLREYLQRDLLMVNLPFEYDFERAIDDWVLLCFFVGNDFLPHLPSLEIRENAIDRLIRLYKDCCYKTGGWLTDSGRINMRRVEIIMENLGRVEDSIFKQRHLNDLEYKRRQKMKQMQEKAEKEAANMFRDTIGIGALGVVTPNTHSVAYGAKGQIMDQRMQQMKGQKRKSNTLNEDQEEEIPDEVKLYEDGFKDRYYESKFEVTKQNTKFRQMVAREYAIGLCWVLRYYYQGCASWNWFFPYHYAPFASDFIGIADLKVNFDLGEPFNPLEQLMGVFPAASRSHVPEPWGELMIDLESPIIDFYPEDFKIDLNGKKFAWQGVALLPFVDENRLKNCLEKVSHLLTEDEKRRNTTLDDRFYIGSRHPSFNDLSDLYKLGLNFETEIPIDAAKYEGVAGSVLLSDDAVCYNGSLDSPVRGLLPLDNCRVVCVRFRNLKYSKDLIFPARRLPNARIPPPVLKPQDLEEQQSRNYRPVIGFNRNMPRASLGASGHRALGHYVPRGHAQSNFNAVPPPEQMFNRGGYSSQRGRGSTSQWRERYPSDREGFGSHKRGQGDHYSLHHSSQGYFTHGMQYSAQSYEHNQFARGSGYSIQNYRGRVGNNNNSFRRGM